MVFGMILEWKTGFGKCTFKGKVCFPLEQVSMVISCETETGDGSKGSGALYVSGFDGSFPYILAGEFVCTLSKLLSIKNSPFFYCCMLVVSDVSRESILYDSIVR